MGRQLRNVLVALWGGLGIALSALLWSPQLLAAPASAPRIILATGSDRVDVTSRFTGRELLVFGALAHPGQIIVTLRSPDSSVAVTRKDPFGPLWITGRKVTVSHLAGVWQIAASAPPDQLLSPSELQRLGLTPDAGMASAQYQPQPSHLPLWSAAVLKAKEREGSYVFRSHGVHIQDGHLFTVRLHLPATLPLGRYTLTVYQIDRGQVVASREQHLQVQQVGLEQKIADFAEQKPWAYGVVLTLILAGLGLGLGVLMQRKG